MTAVFVSCSKLKLEHQMFGQRNVIRYKLLVFICPVFSIPVGPMPVSLIAIAAVADILLPVQDLVISSLIAGLRCVKLFGMFAQFAFIPGAYLFIMTVFLLALPLFENRIDQYLFLYISLQFRCIELQYLYGLNQFRCHMIFHFSQRCKPDG